MEQVNNANPNPTQRPPRVYRGKPENQKDPNAIHQAPSRSQNPGQSQQGRQNSANIPRKLNPPTHRAANDAAKPTVSSTNPAEGSVFTSEISVRETRQRQTFQPSAPAAIEISRQTFAEMLTDDPQLSKVLLPEYLDYYTTALLWLRFTNLKQKNSQPMTQTEQDLLTLTQTTSFCVPEPLALQVRQIGNLQTMTKQHLYPEFPELPVEQINGQGGYYGAIQLPGPDVDNSIHNLYEEIPCMGVTSEAVRQSISEAAPGNYVSQLNINADNPVNQNLLGYRPLGIRRPEAKNLAFNNGITADEFPSYPAGTGFNFEFLQAISNQLARSSTFKNNDIVFCTLSEIGAQSQIIISRPVVQLGRTNLRGETRPTSLTQETPSHYGSAVFFDSQLIKTPGVNNAHNTWCCVNVHGGIPNAWIHNRNERRNLPIQYHQEVFQAISLDAMTYRINIIKQLVTTKR